MQIINQIGHIQHWGLSPAINILQNVKAQDKQSNECQPIRILMSGCSDIRHILKTICDIKLQENESKVTKFKSIQIYFHETNKELLCRCLLFLHIIHETNLNFQERIEIFLDLFGNAMIKERNSRYLHHLRDDLLNFIHDEKNVMTPLKKIVNLKHLKFQDRDEISSIIQSWSNKVPFDMQKLRDSKLRFLYKERYDYRANLVDWDYNMMLNQCAPLVHYYHYKEWRLSGIAFQQRFSTYCEPNRTLSSYAEGKKKQERTSCLVRGYWGDIVISPYISMGVKCNYKQSDLLFKKANYKYIGHSVELSQYNMNYWLKMIETGEEYVKVFRDYYRLDEETKKKMDQQNQQEQKAKDNLKQIKEEEEPEEQQEKTKQEEVNKKEEQKEIVQKQNDQKQSQEEVQQKKQSQLDPDEEELKRKVDLINSKEIVYDKNEKQVLAGFKKYGLQIHLMSMKNQNLMKGKFRQFFDVVVLGFIHSAYLNKDVQSLVKKQGLIISEKATYLIPKKKEERVDLNAKLNELLKKDNQFKLVEENAETFTYIKIDK